jgi:GMP reductase
MGLLSYDDVCLIPSFSNCKSRRECDTSTNFLGTEFSLPVMPANMKAVINYEWAQELDKQKIFYSMHRFDIDIQKFIEHCNRDMFRVISASFGVKDDVKQIVANISTSGARLDFATIDIAHGHCESMKETLRYFKEKLPNTKLIGGNVATPEAVRDLAKWGADAVKVGIGQGSPCTTKNKTGFTMPMFSCVESCSGRCKGATIFDDCGSNVDDCEEIPIIADGGIGHNGDITKALVAGADFIMAGGIFASCVDSPATSVEVDGILHKAYFGSASFENKKSSRNIEGKLKKLPQNGMTLSQKIQEIKEDLQSSISYGGGTKLSDLKRTKYLALN